MNLIGFKRKERRVKTNYHQAPVPIAHHHHLFLHRLQYNRTVYNNRITNNIKLFVLLFVRQQILNQAIRLVSSTDRTVLLIQLYLKPYQLSFYIYISTVLRDVNTNTQFSEHYMKYTRIYFAEIFFQNLFEWFRLQTVMESQDSTFRV